MTEVYLMQASVFADETLFRKGMQLVSAERAEKIRNFKNPAVARLSLGAGVLLAVVLEKHGRKWEQDAIIQGEYGKPFLPNTDFHFSLSHSGEYALCAVSDAPVGVDLQKVKETIPSKTKRILSSEEEQYLQTLPDTQKIEWFYRLWSRKESLIKWDGRGLRLPLSEFSFVLEGVMQDELHFAGKKLYFQEYSMLAGYGICVCAEKDAFSQEIEEITAENINKILNV